MEAGWDSRAEMRCDWPQGFWAHNPVQQRDAWVYTLSIHCSLCIPGGAVSSTWAIFAMEVGDAAASCTCCNQFHFKGQESSFLLNTQLCPISSSGNKTTECMVYSRSSCFSPTESLYLYIPAEFQTLHWTPRAFVPSLSQVHWAAAAGRPCAGQG